MVRGTSCIPMQKQELASQLPGSRPGAEIGHGCLFDSRERGSRQHEAGVGNEEKTSPHGVLAKVPDVGKGRLGAGEGQEDAGEGAPARVSKRLEVDVACADRILPQ